MKKKLKAKKSKKSQKSVTLRADQRIRLLRHFCDPVPDNYKSPFDVLGILPHGMPLFADGSTQCALCTGVKFHEDLSLGLCMGCVKEVMKIANAINIVREFMRVNK